RRFHPNPPSWRVFCCARPSVHFAPHAVRYVLTHRGAGCTVLPSTEDAAMGDATAVVAYKGFKRDFTCRGFQYRVGQTYEHDGEVEVCESGFHACEHPLDVFRYYAPATSRFAAVTLSGELSRDSDDSKVAASRIMIEEELSLHELIERAI